MTEPTIKLPDLPYALDALEPFISKKALDLHYNKHHKGYVDKLNDLIQDTEYENMSLEQIICETMLTNQSIYNNAAQTWNHSFFWKCLKPKDQEVKADLDQLKATIDRTFGSVENFKKDFTEEAKNLFGSGWVWVIPNEDKLMILTSSNAGSPVGADVKPILVLDVWEHAYYVDYENKRADYIKGFLDHINWDFVADNYSKYLEVLNG